MVNKTGGNLSLTCIHVTGWYLLGLFSSTYYIMWLFTEHLLSTLMEQKKQYIQLLPNSRKNTASLSIHQRSKEASPFHIQKSFLLPVCIFRIYPATYVHLCIYILLSIHTIFENLKTAKRIVYIFLLQKTKLSDICE